MGYQTVNSVRAYVYSGLTPIGDIGASPVLCHEQN